MRPMLCAAFVIAVAMSVSLSDAQPPPPGKGKDPAKKQKKEPPRPTDSFDPLVYLMSFDKNKDGKLTREELLDVRLHRLFDRADANKTGFLTRDQLEAFLARMADEDRSSDKGAPKEKAKKGGPLPRPKN